MDEEKKTELRERVKRLCLSAYPPHNWDDHLIPVVNSALKLQQIHGGDRFIIEVGAYMHDIGRVLFDYLKFAGVTHEISGFYYTRFKLWQYGFDRESRRRIAKCVLEHSYSGISGYRPTSLESKIVLNADAIAAFEKWKYQFSIYYSTRGRDKRKTKRWLLGKLDLSWEKLTLPGTKEEIQPLYDIIKQAMERIN